MEAFNAPGAPPCPGCGTAQPPAFSFRAQASAGLAQAEQEHVEQALGELAAVEARWNEPALRLSELQEGKPAVVGIGVRRIAVVRQGDQVSAISATCPHYGGPLALGEVRRGELICPWHRFRFSLANGQSVTNPALCAPMYDVKVEGDNVIITGQRAVAVARG